MIKQETTNTFNKGLIMDVNPLVSPNDSLTNALNATFITMNGNEQVLQNDKGNVEVITESGVKALLPEGYIPVGMKEHGGIIYVASVRPSDGMCQIGSFPSPQYVYGNNLFGKILIDFYKDTSRTDKYFILTNRYLNDVTNTINSLYISDDTTPVEYFKKLWDNLDISYSLIDRNGSGWYILTFNILTLVNQKLLYPLFLTDQELLKLKAGDLITILSNVLLNSSNSNVVNAINSGAISLLWMVNTTYSGLYILNNSNVFQSSVVPGIGSPWYYLEPSSTLSLQVQFNIVYPFLGIKKYEDKITYSVEKTDLLLSVLFIDKYGNYIPMEEVGNTYTISTKRNPNINNNFTVSAVPITTYAGLIPQGKVDLLVNNRYIYNEITLWKYKYSDNSAEFLLQYTNDEAETLKKLKIELLDLSKLDYNQILLLTELTISTYKTDKEIEFDITLPGIVTGIFTDLLDSHLYLAIIQKTITSDSEIDVIETIGYRFLYACSIYNNYYNTYNDYNNISSSDLQIIDTVSIPYFTISLDEEVDITTHSKLYYNYDGGWSGPNVCLGNWLLEKPNSAVNKKVNQYIFDVNIPISTNIEINPSIISNLGLLYGGVFNDTEILELFLESNKNISIDGGYLITPQEEVINDNDLSSLIKTLDNINGSVSIELNDKLYIKLHDVSNSYGFTLTNDSVRYYALNRLTGINNLSYTNYKYVVTYYDSRLGNIVPISSNYKEGLVRDDTFVYTTPSLEKTYEQFNKNSLTNNLYIINTYPYLSYDNSITPMYLKFKYGDLEFKVINANLPDNVLLPNKYLICLLSNYNRGSIYFLPIIIDGGEYSEKFSLNDKINNILTSITSNFYTIQLRELLTIKCPYDSNNIVKFNNYNIEILNSNYLTTYNINSYHIQDGITPMEDIFKCVCKNFSINNINTKVQINSIYTDKISLSITNMNDDFLSMKNQCANKNYSYYTINNFSTIFSPEVTYDKVLSTNYIINDDYLVKDHLGNIKSNEKGYLFIPETTNVLVKKLMKSLIDLTIEYIPNLVFLNPTTLVDDTSIIDTVDDNIVTFPTVITNLIDICYNSYDQGREWPMLPFKMIDLYIEGLTPITISDE